MKLINLYKFLIVPISCIARVQATNPYGLAFFLSDDKTQGGLCDDDLAAIKDEITTAYLVEIVDETTVTSQQIMDQQFNYTGRRLAGCNYWICTQPYYYIVVRGCLSYCGYRRLKGDATNRTTPNEKDGPIGSRSNIVKGAGAATAKLFYELVDRKVEGQCHGIISNMTYQILNVTFA
jgi:hypothetical protein